MSILSDFLSAYKPVHVMQFPISAQIYNSNAISGFAEITSNAVEKLSGNFANYETHEELSIGVNTNQLSAGVLSVDNAIFSVEHINDYDILNVNGARVYSITGENIIQSALPRRELDSRITVFKDSENNKFYKLIALVDDTSMTNPDAPVFMNVDVIEIAEDALTYHDEIYERVFMRVPGQNEHYSVEYIEVGLSYGKPGIKTGAIIDDLSFTAGQVVDSIVFTGSAAIKATGKYAPERVTALFDGNAHLWLIADSEYSQRVVEDQARVYYDRLNIKIDQLSSKISVDIPEPATKISPADTLSGSVGNSTLYAREDHSHPRDPAIKEINDAIDTIKADIKESELTPIAGRDDSNIEKIAIELDKIIGILNKLAGV